MKDELRPFVEVKHGDLEQRRIFGFRQDIVRSQRTGKEARVDRLQFPDWVNVVAFTDDDELILVRQWRFGTRAFSVEIPAGALEHGEDPIDGGLRELREETGYTPVDRDAVVLVGATRPNAAFTDNRCFTVFVPRAQKTHPQALDEMEEVAVLTLPRAQIDDAIRRGAARAIRDDASVQGVAFDNSLVVVALELWRLRR